MSLFSSSLVYTFSIEQVLHRMLENKAGSLRLSSFPAGLALDLTPLSLFLGRESHSLFFPFCTFTSSPCMMMFSLCHYVAFLTRRVGGESICLPPFYPDKSSSLISLERKEAFYAIVDFLCSVRSSVVCVSRQCCQSREQFFFERDRQPFMQISSSSFIKRSGLKQIKFAKWDSLY